MSAYVYVLRAVYTFVLLLESEIYETKLGNVLKECDEVKESIGEQDQSIHGKICSVNQEIMLCFSADKPTSQQRRFEEIKHQVCFQKDQFFPQYFWNMDILDLITGTGKFICFVFHYFLPYLKILKFMPKCCFLL